MDLAGTDAAPAEAGDGGEAEDDASVSADGLLSGLVSPMDESGKSLSLVDHLKKIIIKKEIDVDAKDIIVSKTPLKHKHRHRHRHRGIAHCTCHMSYDTCIPCVDWIDILHCVALIHLGECWQGE